MAIRPMRWRTGGFRVGRMITTTAPTKSYQQMPVVRSVSLPCEPRTITGSLGANGAGLLLDPSLTAAKAAPAQEAAA